MKWVSRESDAENRNSWSKCRDETKVAADPERSDSQKAIKEIDFLTALVLESGCCRGSTS